MMGSHFTVRVVHSVPAPTDRNYPQYTSEQLFEINMETLDLNALLQFLCAYKILGDNLRPAEVSKAAPGTWVAVTELEL